MAESARLRPQEIESAALPLFLAHKFWNERKLDSPFPSFPPARLSPAISVGLGLRSGEFYDTLFFAHTLHNNATPETWLSLSPLFPHANSRSSSSPCLSPSLLPTFPTPHGGKRNNASRPPPPHASSRREPEPFSPPPPSLQFVGEHSRREVEERAECYCGKKRVGRRPFIHTVRGRGGSHFGIRRRLLRSKNRQTNVDGEGPGRKLFPNETAL